MNWIWIILSNGKSHGKEQIMTPSSAKDSKENKGKDIFLKDIFFPSLNDKKIPLNDSIHQFNQIIPFNKNLAP